MRDLKFRSNASMVAYRNSRRSRRGWWAIPLAILATGGLYAAFGTQASVTASSPSPKPDGASIMIPLALPGGGQADAAKPSPPAAVTVAKIEPTRLDAVEHAPNAVDAAPAGSAARQATESETATATDEDGDHWLTHTVASGESLATIFHDLGLSPTLLHQIVHSDAAARQLAHIRPGQTLRVRLLPDGEFAEMVFRISATKILRVTSDGDEMSAMLEVRDTTQHQNQVSGVIESSLFESAQKAGLSDALTMQLAKIFGWDIDFALEIRSGDRFEVVYAEQWLEGKKLGDGPILAAEFVNQGKPYRAVRFVDNKGRASYYTPDGREMRKEFLRTPVKFTRISSRFTLRRWHPILKRWRSHRGVDYAAPTGTPVKAAGDGSVTFVGKKGGYGNVIFLAHRGHTSTVYGHLSRFAKGLRRGKHVHQGQLIGYVGHTGLATGPHLHYEFRINGVYRDPLTVTHLPPAPIAKKYMPAFRKATQPLLAQLDSMNRTVVADAR